MDEAQVLEALERGGALSPTHREVSGEHRLLRFERFDPLADPGTAGQLGEALAGRLAEGGYDLVAIWDGVETAVLGYVVGRALGRPVVRILDHEGLITASAPIPAGTRAVFVAPAILDAQEPRLTRALMEARDATLHTVATLVDLGEQEAASGVPTVALARIASYAPDDCPACRRGQPLVNPRVPLAPGGRHG
jgi:orotate phosphoribosyltransferase